MYIKYNKEIYDCLNQKSYYEIITRNSSKTDEMFEKYYMVYIKQIQLTDPLIEDIFKVDFYVNYMDDSETLKAAGADGVWCVNEGQPMHCPPELEKNEVGLNLFYGSLSPDWVQYDKGCSSKIVDLYECSDYTVKYTYSVKGGETLAQSEVVEVKMDAEAFKEEMLKYRIEFV